jgi:hypothetical protein
MRAALTIRTQRAGRFSQGTTRRNRPDVCLRKILFEVILSIRDKARAPQCLIRQSSMAQGPSISEAIGTQPALSQR